MDLKRNQTLKLSFVIPCYCSENTIRQVILEIANIVEKMEVTYEIIAVDDNSPDHVHDVLLKLAAENCNVKVIRFTKNFGQHAGLMAGIRASSGEIVVTLDDDGQCPIDRLSDLIAPLQSGWDISIAQYGRKKQSCFKNICSYLNEVAANVLIDKPSKIQMGNFMAFKRFVADEIKRYIGPYPYISGLLFRSSNRVINVPMCERQRIAGHTTYTLRKLFMLWISSFTAFSIKPLRFAAFSGIMVACFGLLYGIIIVIKKIMNPYVTIGWTSIIVLLSVLGGLILFVLGILGEYVGRIYMTLNETPQYVIADSTEVGTMALNTPNEKPN